MRLRVQRRSAPAAARLARPPLLMAASEASSPSAPAAAPSPAPAARSRRAARFGLSDKRVLIASALLAGLCSLVYELLISTTAAYFLGDSVRQFSLTIGLYLAAMGLGSYASRFVQAHLLRAFVATEIALGFVGGLCVPVLYLAYPFAEPFWPVVTLLTLLVGALTGLEIPLLTRLVREHDALDASLADVLSFDYLGALLATLAFPFVLLPVLGTFRASLVLGLVNMTVGFLNLVWFAGRMRLGRRALWTASLGVTALLGALLAVAQPLLDQWSDRVYEDRVIYREQTRYQQVVVTRYRDDVRLFLNGNLQFSSLDEQRYHEPLVHVPLGLMPARSPAPAPSAKGLRVLVLGGGDGLAARELLKHAAVAHVTVVDLDPAVFALARTHPALTRLNARSLHSPRVTTVAQDALVFLEDGPPEGDSPEDGSPEDDPTRAAAARYDVIVADLPDPNNISLARLYSRGFYRLVRRRLAPGGVFVTQATSPYFARDAFWCIAATVEAAGFATVRPYHASVPSFGEWGFVLAADRPLNPAAVRLPAATRFLTDAVVPGLFAFPADLARPTPAPPPSTLDRPRVLGLYLDGWRYWN